MTNREKINSFQADLLQFIGTCNYYHIMPFKTLVYTDGFKYFMENAGNGAHWFYMIIATEILPKLKDDLFFIELKVNKDNLAKITAFRDKGEPLIFEKDIEYTDCPYSEEPYELCMTIFLFEVSFILFLISATGMEKISVSVQELYKHQKEMKELSEKIKGLESELE